jgi:hypothetical protein
MSSNINKLVQLNEGAIGKIGLAVVSVLTLGQIAKHLDKMSPGQQEELAMKMKDLVQTAPEKVKALGKFAKILYNVSMEK